MRTSTKRLARSLVALALVGGTFAAVGSGPASAESNGGVRIMPLGDSITDGFTVQGGYRTVLWQDFVSAGAKVDFVGSQYNGPSTLGDHDHEGHSGWTIDQIDANLVGWLQATQPRTVLLHIGTNDILHNNTPSTAPARLSAQIDKILATVPGVDVFVATIIPLGTGFTEYNPAVNTYNAAIPGIVASKGSKVHLVDQHAALTASDLADGIHPNEGGYAKMAAVWWAALKQVPGSYTGGGTTTTTTRTTTTTTTRTTTTTTRTTTTTTRPTTTTTRPTTTTTTRTTTTTTRPTTTTGGGGGTGGCSASYAVTNSWGAGFIGEVKVTAGSAAISGWKVTLTLPSGTSLANVWNGVNSGTTGAVTVTNAGYNGGLAAGGSTTFGFQGNGSGTGATVTCAAS